MKKLFLSLMSISFLSGCATVNSVSLTPIPAERKNEVKVQTSRMIFLGFNFDNNYVDNLVEELKQKCPNGRVTGILTKDENINYFLYIVWKKQVTASGYCLQAKSAQKTRVKKR